MRMRKSWSAAKNEESKEEQRAKMIRRIALGVFVVVIFYVVFGTDLWYNIVKGLLGN